MQDWPKPDGSLLMGYHKVEEDAGLLQDLAAAVGDAAKNAAGAVLRGGGAKKAEEKKTEEQPLEVLSVPGLWRDNLTQVYELPPVVLVVLDQRSERTFTEVMSPEVWDRLFGRLERIEAQQVEHFVFLVPVPLVHVDFGAVEQAFTVRKQLIGVNASEMDDFADHWTNKEHRRERLGLLERLLKLARSKSARCTVVSGDVHSGGLGYVDEVMPPPASPGPPSGGGDGGGGNLGRLVQLTSSGICAHPHGDVSVAAKALALLPYSWEDRPGLRTHGEAPGKSDPRLCWDKFLCERNFMRLGPDEEKPGSLSAQWFVCQGPPPAAGQNGTDDMRFCPYTTRIDAPRASGPLEEKG